jgi:hypothetical protein
MVYSEMLCHVAVVRTNVSVVFLHSMCRLLVTASVPSSPILVTLMKESLSSSETSVLTRVTWRNIPEDTILQHFAMISEKKDCTALRGWEVRAAGNSNINIV